MTRLLAQAEIAEMKKRIKQHYPDAIIRIHRATQPRVINFDVYTDAENAWDMQELIKKPRLEALINKEYLISVVPQPRKYFQPVSRQVANKANSKPRSSPRQRSTRESKSGYRVGKSKRGKK